MHIEMGMARLCAEAEDRMPEGASDAGAACRYRHRYRTQPVPVPVRVSKVHGGLRNEGALYVHVVCHARGPSGGGGAREVVTFSSSDS